MTFLSETLLFACIALFVLIETLQALLIASNMRNTVEKLLEKITVIDIKKFWKGRLIVSKSSIEWTQETWNPITGCTKYSEGCKNCYAEKMHKRLQAMDFQTGKNKKYRRDFSWVKFHSEELSRDFGKKPKMIFVNSMSDTFHKDISSDDIFFLLLSCEIKQQHIFQILTKRSKRLKNFKYPSNVWLGVTVEHSDYKHRIDDLKQTNASVKFLSCEPLLGDLGELNLTGIDWVICGGESGHNARPCHPDWIRNIQRQCAEQNVPFFFKQWGEWQVVYERGKGWQTEEEGELYDLCRTKFKSYTRLNLAGGYGYHGENLCYFKKVGKKNAGSKLDGIEYKEWPRKEVVQNA